MLNIEQQSCLAYTVQVIIFGNIITGVGAWVVHVHVSGAITIKDNKQQVWKLLNGHLFALSQFLLSPLFLFAKFILWIVFYLQEKRLITDHSSGNARISVQTHPTNSSK